MFDPWVGKILWSKKWQSTPVFLPEKFHSQKSLAGSSPWSHKEMDMTEHTQINMYLYIYLFMCVCVNVHTHIYTHIYIRASQVAQQ